MKQLLYLAIGIFTTAILAQDNSQQEIWFKFQTPTTDAVTHTGIPDTPFILKNEHGTPTEYTVAAYFEAMSNPKISDVMIDINHISAKFDRRGRQIIYLSGKVDLSCCFNGEMSLDFYDAEDNLVQKARTDALGNFKLKSINGNMFTIKGDKIKFNFTKIKTFDLNADIRYASVSRIKRSLGSENSNQETSIVKKVVKNDKK